MFTARPKMLKSAMNIHPGFQYILPRSLTTAHSLHCSRAKRQAQTKSVRSYASFIERRPGTLKKRPRFAATCVGESESSASFHDLPAPTVLRYVSAADTIYALSSGAGVTAGVAIIRISGPGACFCLEKMLRSGDEGHGDNAKRIPKPRYASVRKLYHPVNYELLDEALVLFFPGPRSFTGEDVVELHVHGSRAVIAGVIEALGNLRQDEETASTIRPAERGEFTRRAFENGRMDLTSVEGLSDLISAETAMQRRQALRQLGGEVRDILEGWRGEIKTCLAHAEAVIDFGDDVDDEAFEAIVPRIDALHRQMQGYLNDKHRGEIVRGGARVAIVGEPNAGKSTLLNALARRPAAIVSPQEGTTRDVVEVQLDLNGMAVVVSDTAGLREKTTDPIELEGMRRARDVAAAADVTILVHDASRGDLDHAISSFPTMLNPKANFGDDTVDKSLLLCVANKVDLVPEMQVSDFIDGVKVFKTSLLKGIGISELTTEVEEVLLERLEGGNHNASQCATAAASKRSDAPVITRARHRHHLTAAVTALASFLEGRTGPDRALYLPMDLAAEDLRIAAKELGAITGIIHAEEVLDVIFSEFCIGK